MEEALEEIIRRLDDLDRSIKHPFVREGDIVYYVDPATGERIQVSCPCPPETAVGGPGDPIPSGPPPQTFDYHWRHYPGFFFPQPQSQYLWNLPPGPDPTEDDFVMAATSTVLGNLVQSGAPATWTEDFNNTAVSGGFASMWHHILPGQPAGGRQNQHFAVLSPSLRNFHDFAFHVFPCSAVFATAGPQIGGSTFPIVNSPGPGWMIVYVVITESLDGFTIHPFPGSIPIAGSSYALDPAITLNTTLPQAWPGQLTDGGDDLVGHELAPVTGPMPARSVSIVGANYLLYTMVLDTR